MAQEGNFLGILGRDTVNNLSQNGDGIVEMGNKNMKENIFSTYNLSNEFLLSYQC